jgi:O-antigen/teichoic acid export membrane protein
MASMAGYSLASTYAFLPSLAVNSLLQRLFLPLLVGQEDAERFNQRYRVIRRICVAAALSFFALFLLIGPRGVELLMSDKYESIYPLTLIMALAAGVRTLRCSLVIPLLANGQTRMVLWGSLARCVGLVIAVAFAIWVHDLLWIAAAAIIGELLAAVVSIVVIRRSSSLKHCTIVSELLPFVSCVVLLAATHTFLDRHLPIPLVTGTLFAGMVFVMARRSLVELKRE